MRSFQRNSRGTAVGAEGDGAAQSCAVPGCSRPIAQAQGRAMGPHCRYHVQFKARHGSHWCSTYFASDLKPYLRSAARWIKENREVPQVAMALYWLNGLLLGAGRTELAHRIKGMPARERARVAFARLQEAGVEAERIIRIYLAVCTLIEDDAGSHRVEEFRVVQVAKAVHRLASGSHQRWEVPLRDGRTAPLAMHTYPVSSGFVLRVIGRQIEEACREVASASLDEIRGLKRERFGPHPSQQPGWLPPWQRQRRTAR